MRHSLHVATIGFLARSTIPAIGLASDGLLRASMAMQPDAAMLGGEGGVYTYADFIADRDRRAQTVSAPDDPLPSVMAMALISIASASQAAKDARARTIAAGGKAQNAEAATSRIAAPNDASSVATFDRNDTDDDAMAVLFLI